MTKDWIAKRRITKGKGTNVEIKSLELKKAKGEKV